MKYPILAILLSLAVSVHSYDSNQALTALYFSKASYCSVSNINDWNCLPCQHSSVQGAQQTQTFTNSHNGEQAFVTYHPASNQIIVSFRGSANIQNWLENLSIMKSNWETGTCKSCEVHSGFADIWKSLKVGILSYVSTLQSQHSASHILVTGHSLGGAVATLAAVDLRQSYGGMVNLINFGSPRVGNSHFFNKVKQLFGPDDFRIVHKADIVPHWPKAFTKTGYHHIEKEVWYQTATSYIECDDSGEDKKCSNSVLGSSINDHLAYLGHSTQCNNADAIHLSILQSSISDSSLNFYDQFEEIVLDCNVTGYVQSFAKKYGQRFLEKETQFKNQRWVQKVIKCQQETLFNKVENFTEYPTCDDLMEYGLQSFIDCFQNPDPQDINLLNFDYLVVEDILLIEEIIQGDLLEYFVLSWSHFEEVYSQKISEANDDEILNGIENQFIN